MGKKEIIKRHKNGGGEFPHRRNLIHYIFRAKHKRYVEDAIPYKRGQYGFIVGSIHESTEIYKSSGGEETHRRTYYLTSDV